MMSNHDDKQLSQPAMKSEQLVARSNEMNNLRKRTAPAVAVSPELRAAGLIKTLTGTNASSTELMQEIDRRNKAIKAGDMSQAEGILAAQALTLDALFSDLTKRALRSEYQEQFTAYMKLALRAQAQSARTIETLGTLKSPKQIAFVNQANIGNQVQVNNGTEPTRA